MLNFLRRIFGYREEEKVTPVKEKSMRCMSIIIFAVFLLLSPEYALGENELPKTMNVDVALVPPMVVKRDNAYTGFDIELLEAIADELGVSVTHREVPFARIFDGIKNGEAHAAIAGITITEEREKFIDFSHHYFDSGLSILVPDVELSTPEYVWDIFVKNRIYKWFFYLSGFVFLLGNMIWFSEHKKEHISQYYIPGIFDACYFVVVTMATVGYGDIAPKTWSGRIVAMGIMMFGIAFFTLSTGNLISAMTVERIKHDIQGPSDLEGKDVATLAGTTSVDYLRGIGARVHAVSDISDSFSMLEKGGVDAVVYDTPVLLYYEHHEGRGKVMITGSKFEEQYYGIAFPQESTLREPINRALLKLRQNGFYENLYKKWFGGS